MTLTPLSEQDILNGAAMALEDPEYDQTRWCACIFHYAMNAAGDKTTPRGSGPHPDQTPPTPRGETMRAMFGWTHEDTARLIPHIDESGAIHTPLDSPISDRIGRGVVIHPNATINRGVEIGDRSIIEEETELDRDCYIGQDCIIGTDSCISSHAHIEDGVDLPSFTHIGPHECVNPGDYE